MRSSIVTASFVGGCVRQTYDFLQAGSAMSVVNAMIANKEKSMAPKTMGVEIPAL